MTTSSQSSSSPSLFPPAAPTAENPKFLYKLRGTERHYDANGDLMPQVLWRQYTWSQMPAAVLTFPLTMYRFGQWCVDNQRNTYEPDVLVPRGEVKTGFVIKGECEESFIAPDPVERFEVDYSGPWKPREERDKSKE